MLWPPKLSSKHLVLLCRNPPVCPALGMACVLSCDLVASDVGHLESFCSLSYGDVPDVDVFHCVKKTPNQTDSIC